MGKAIFFTGFILVFSMETFAQEVEKDIIGKFKLFEFKPTVYSKSKIEKHIDNSISKVDSIRKALIQHKIDILLKTGSAHIADSIFNAHSILLEKSIYKMDSIQKRDKMKNKNIIIQTVEFSISEGIIENIRVKARDSLSNKERFFQSDKKIPLKKMSQTEAELFDILNDNYFLKANDFIYYLPMLAEFCLPDDDNFSIDSDSTEHNITANIDLNSNLDVRVYSDLFSLFNKASNGLLQTEIRSKIKINFSDSYIFNRTPFATYFDYIEPSVKYSKFDSDYNSLNIEDSLQEEVTLSRKEKLTLNQLSYLNLGVKLNLIRHRMLNSFFEYNIGYNYDFVDLKLKNSTINYTVNMFSSYIESKARFAKSKYYGFDISFMYLIQTFTKTGININTEKEDYFIPEFTAYFLPKGDVSNRLFLRFKCITSMRTSQSYPLLQFGYGSKLNFSRK